MVFFCQMIPRYLFNKGKLRVSRSSQGSAMMKGPHFPFLSSTLRKCLIYFGTSDVALTTECPQDRCAATRLLIGILPDRYNGCQDGQAAYAIPPGCHSGFAIRHWYPKCVYPTIQTHRFALG